MSFELIGLVLGNIDASENPAVIGAVIAIVEQADIPVRAYRIQKFQQRTRALGKLEAEQSFVRDARRASADHVAYMQLRHFVVGQVLNRVTGIAQFRDQLLAFVSAPGALLELI